MGHVEGFQEQRFVDSCRPLDRSLLYQGEHPGGAGVQGSVLASVRRQRSNVLSSCQSRPSRPHRSGLRSHHGLRGTQSCVGFNWGPQVHRAHACRLGAHAKSLSHHCWYSDRTQLPHGLPTELVTTQMLPDTAQAMLLATFTTAAAFFGTAMCPVALILMFTVICGLLVVFNYCLCVLLVFPALCAWDQQRQQQRAEGRQWCCN